MTTTTLVREAVQSSASLIKARRVHEFGPLEAILLEGRVGRPRGRAAKAHSEPVAQLPPARYRMAARHRPQTRQHRSNPKGAHR